MVDGRQPVPGPVWPIIAEKSTISVLVRTDSILTGCGHLWGTFSPSVLGLETPLSFLTVLLAFGVLFEYVFNTCLTFFLNYYVLDIRSIFGFWIS